MKLVALLQYLANTSSPGHPGATFESSYILGRVNLLMPLMLGFLTQAACAAQSPLREWALNPGPENIQWPTSEELDALEPVAAGINGEAALAAAAAISEATRTWEGQGLFKGCPTPAAGLRATVFPWKGNYYVIVGQQFDRCGGGRYRMLDWGESFAVSPEGRILARESHAL